MNWKLDFSPETSATLHQLMGKERDQGNALEIVHDTYTW